MTGSYKIALALAGALFVFVVGYYVLQDWNEPQRPGVDEPVASEVEPTAPPRQAPPTNLSQMTRSTPPGTGQPASPQQVVQPEAPSSDIAARIEEYRRRLAEAQQRVGTEVAPSTPLERSSMPEPPRPGVVGPQPAPVASASQSGIPTDQSSPQPGAGVVAAGPQPRIGPNLPANPGVVAAAGAQGAAAAAPGAVRPATPATYTVQTGDTLSSIARQVFGSETRWDEIAKANPLVDPLRLKVGQILRLPSAQAPAATGEARAAAPGRVVTYTIRPGDTLSTIAQQFYGSAGDWRYIFNANRDKLGNNPDAIRAGMQITIPPAPRAAE